MLMCTGQADDLIDGSTYAITQMWSSGYAQPIIKPFNQEMALTSWACFYDDDMQAMRFAFARPLLVPADVTPSNNITAGPSDVVFAWGDSQTFGYHGPRRGSKTLELFAEGEG